MSDDKDFVCPVCKSCFTKLYNFNRHLRTHSEDKPFACTKCSFRCREKANLRKHILNMHTEEKRFQCPDCDYSCARSDQFRYHRAKHTGQYEYECGMCGHKCTNASDLKKHVLTHSENKQHQCDYCDYSTHRKPLLTVHIQAYHADVKPFVCGICSFTPTTSRGLKIHMRVHTGEKPYACTECDYRSAYKSILTRHMLTHNTERKYQCQHCDMSYNHRPGLARHILRMHSTVDAQEATHDEKLSQATQNCSTVDLEGVTHDEELNQGTQNCDRDDREELSHDEKHNNSTTFLEGGTSEEEMNLCTADLTSDDKLLKQATQNCSTDELGDVAHNEKLDDDDLIARSNTSVNASLSIASSDLKKHLLTHSKNKKHQCDYCDYSTHRRSRLTAHIQAYHADVKPFVCGICSFTPTTARGLRIHMRVHTGEKPYACTECDYRSAYKSILTRHMLTHNTERKYQCQHCDMSYNHRPGLVRHILRKHSRTDDHGVTHDKELNQGTRNCSTGNLEGVDLDEKQNNSTTLLEGDTSDKEMNLRTADLTQDDKLLKQATNNCSTDELEGVTHDEKRNEDGLIAKSSNTSVNSSLSIASLDLEKHVLTYSGNKQHQCEYCDFSTHRRPLLTAHIRAYHPDVKPFVCGICSFTPTTAKGLRIHMRVHTGEKPYACTECDYRSAYKSILTRHMLIHNTECKYQCQHCDMSYNHRPGLARHILRMHSRVDAQEAIYDEEQGTQNCSSTLLEGVTHDEELNQGTQNCSTTLLEEVTNDKEMNLCMTDLTQDEKQNCSKGGLEGVTHENEKLDEDDLIARSSNTSQDTSLSIASGGEGFTVKAEVDLS